MTKENSDQVQRAADRVIELEEEVEASGYAAVDDRSVTDARAVLHRWVDSVAGVVISPGLGRVTLIHENGRRSTITSPELPFLMSQPAHASGS